MHTVLHTHIHAWLVLILLMIWVCLKIGQPAKVAVSKVYPVLRQDIAHISYPHEIQIIPIASHWISTLMVELTTGWWFGTWILFSISYMGCHPSHWWAYFSRWLLHHQPDNFLGGFLMITSHLEQRTQWAQDPPSLHPLQLRWPKELVVGSPLLSRHLA